jgi:hypothetical protein
MWTKTRAECGRPEIVRWRREQFVHAGFFATPGVRLAKDPGCDLHALIELVERGCPPELATRILAPLEVGDAA